MISRIEIDFAIPVELTDDQEATLQKLVSDIARANQPTGKKHWLFGSGSKPTFSQADCRFMGKPVDPNAPESGEPTFDDEILYYETAVKHAGGAT